MKIFVEQYIERRNSYRGDGNLKWQRFKGWVTFYFDSKKCNLQASRECAQCIKVYPTMEWKIITVTIAIKHTYH